MFSFAIDRPRRRASLTPMIDVVFLLLIFFMLTAQFSRDTTLPLRAAGGAGDYQGPPRLLRIGADGLWLNGRAIALKDTAAALGDLTRSPDDLIVLRGLPDADLQRVVEVMQHLTRAGFTGLTLVE